MDLSLFGHHILLGSNGLDITGPVLQLQLGLLTLLFIGVLIFQLVKRFRSKRQEEDNLWLTFGNSDVRGRRSSYEDAESTLDRFRKKDKVVAVVDVSGIILNERGGVERFTSLIDGAATLGLELGNTLKNIAPHDKLAAVFVRANTPGGTMPGSQYIFDGLRACVKEGKPVYCYVQDLSASGGVWMMVGASRIIAHPRSALGSIGVIGPSLKHFKGVTQIGQGVLGSHVQAAEITSHALFAGKGKNFGDPFGEPDEDAERSLRGLLEEAYEGFLAHVAEYRSIAVERLREMGAIVFSADKAKQLGLIDEIGDQEFAQTALAKELGVDWEDCKLLRLGLSSKKGFSFSLSRMLQPIFPQVALSVENIISIELSKHLVLAVTKLWRV